MDYSSRLRYSIIIDCKHLAKMKKILQFDLTVQSVFLWKVSAKLTPRDRERSKTPELLCSAYVVLTQII